VSKVTGTKDDHMSREASRPWLRVESEWWLGIGLLFILRDGLDGGQSTIQR